MSPVYVEWICELKDTVISTRNIMQIKLPMYKTVKYGKRSVRYQGAYHWNSLDSGIKTCQTLQKFKCAIYEWGKECKCHSCTSCMLRFI